MSLLRGSTWHSSDAGSQVSPVVALFYRIRSDLLLLLRNQHDLYTLHAFTVYRHVLSYISKENQQKHDSSCRSFGWTSVLLHLCIFSFTFIQSSLCSKHILFSQQCQLGVERGAGVSPKIQTWVSILPLLFPLSQSHLFFAAFIALICGSY